MRILVAGSGAIGSLVAAYLADNTELWLLGRSWHLAPIKKRGDLELTLPSGRKKKVEVEQASVVTDPSQLSPTHFDSIFITVKAYDTKTILHELAEANVSADCYVLLQNGLGNEQEASEILETETVLLRGLTNNGAHIPSPGKVVHAGKGITTFGSLRRNFSTWGQKIATLFSESGLPAEYVEDLAPLLWEKVAINAVINPLTALLTVRNRALCENSTLKKLAILVLDEVRAVAQREGIPLKTMEDTVFKVAANTGDNRSSMLQDVLQQKRTEIDFINGAIIERARKHEMTVPVNLCLFLLVKSKEKSYL